jgi:hypothetical protein
VALTLAVYDGSGVVGEDILVPVVLYNSTAGVSGFNLRIWVEDVGIAEIAEVLFPDFLPFAAPLLMKVSEVPDAGVSISSVDLNRIIEPSLQPRTVQLAVLRVRLLKAGVTQLRVSGSPPFGVDDDAGDRIQASIAPGWLEVRD